MIRVLLIAMLVLILLPSAAAPPRIRTWNDCGLVAKRLERAQREDRLYPVNDIIAVNHLSQVYQAASQQEAFFTFALYWPRSRNRITVFLGTDSRSCWAFEAYEADYRDLSRSLANEVPVW